MSDISRQEAIDAFYDAFCYAYCDNCEKEMNEDLCGDCHRKYQNWSASKKIIEKVINNLPSAQPERWIPVKTRPMDEEEKQSIKPYLEEHYGYTLDECDCILFDCPMPEDGEEVWVCSKCGNVWQDTCEIDEGIGLEENGDWEDIVAWMPFNRPEPYKGEEDA